MAVYKAIILTGRGQIKADGTANIKIRITHKRKQTYIPTDLYIMVSDFDSATGMAASGPNRDHINHRITYLIHKYQEKDIALGDSKDFMSVKEIKEFVLSGKTKSRDIDFFEFADTLITNTRNKGTADTYAFTMASLKNFTGHSLPVSEISYNFLLRYENFLRARGAQNGIINYMTTFRSIFNKCRDTYNDEDLGKILIPQYPFKKYKFPKRQPQAKNHVLTLKEIKKLVRYVPEDEGEEFARDMFLLMITLIGIEAKDLFFAAKPQKGRLVYGRFKTQRPYSIKIEPEASEIIRKYKHPKNLLNVSENFQLHKSFYRKINNYLAGEKAHNITGIFPKLKIYKKVTTKWARHTWATLARNECRIPKDDVALCLGHEDEDNRVTDTYIKYDYSIIDRANRKVLDLVF